MTQEQSDTLAAEYALGTLNGESRQRFAENLSSDPALQKLVEAWEIRLESLDRGVTPVEPPAGLWEKIDAALDDAEDSAELGAVTFRASEGRWEPLFEGVEKKVLFFDRTANSQSYLLRIAAGVRLPAHEHKAAEECLLLEGDLSIGDLRLAAGDFHGITGGTAHPEVFSERGALVYIRGELHEAVG